jgi:hypothetical protein
MQARPLPNRPASENFGLEGNGVAPVGNAGRRLEILSRRALELADSVAAGDIPFLDTIDCLYEAALFSGLVDTVGDEIVQATLAAAFANARHP